MSTDFLSNDELEEFARQAEALGWDYHRRGRQMVASYFLRLAGAASGEVKDRARHLERAISVDISIPLDETAPGDHQKDDIGTVLARILQLMDDLEVSEDVNWVWRRIFVELSRQRDELRRRGRIP